MFCSARCPNSEKVQHDPPAPKPQEEIYLAETPFLRVQALLRGPRGPIHLPKNYLGGVKRALKISRRFIQQVKSYDTFSLGQTHGWTDRHKNESPQYQKGFFCIYVGGKEVNTTNPTKFLPLHFMKDKKNAKFFTLHPTKKGRKDQSEAFQRPGVPGVLVESPDQMVAFNKHIWLYGGRSNAKKLQIGT